MNNVIFGIITFLFSCVCIYANAQQKYTIVTLPAKAGCTKQQLNDDIKDIDKDALLIQAIRKRVTTPCLIQLRVKQNDGSIRYAQIRTGIEGIRQGNVQVHQSKSVDSRKVYEWREFKNIFTDTLVVFDTLSIQLRIKDADMNDNPYFLKSNCTSPEKERIVPTTDDRELIFTSQLLAGCKQRPALVSLYNESNTERLLGSSYILFLDNEEKGGVKEMALFLKGEDPGRTLDDIITLLTEYITQLYGRSSRAEIAAWINEHTSLK